MSRHDSAARRPAVAGRPRGIGRFAEAVCRLGYAPDAAESATWRTVPCPVHLPGRRGILAAWHVGRGNPRPGRVSPTDAGLLQARPASRTTGCSPVHGRSCYGQRRIASTRPGRPGLPGGPGEAVKGRHQSAAHYTGVISGSPAKSAGTRPPPQGSPRLPRPVTTGLPQHRCGRDGLQVGSDGAPASVPYVSASANTRFTVLRLPIPLPQSFDVRAINLLLLLQVEHDIEQRRGTFIGQTEI